MHHTTARSARPCAHRLAEAILGIALAFGLAACGGGGGDAPPSPPPDAPMIYGIAANGRALDGTLDVEDSTGHVTSLPLAAGSGRFSLSAQGLIAPFMLKATSADGRTVLYAASPTTGRINVNPLTTLGLLRTAAKLQLMGPADLYAAPASFKQRISVTGVYGDAIDAMRRLMPAFVIGLPGTPTQAPLPVYDPTSTEYALGDAVDRLLDAYPIEFAQDASGAVTVTQADAATGFFATVGRSDTIAQRAIRLVVQGPATVVAGTSAQLTALATFENGSTHAVPASWGIEGKTAGDTTLGTVDAHGLYVPPATYGVPAVPLMASWSDGTQDAFGDLTIAVTPPHLPASLTLTAPSDPVPANGDARLQATVHWADGIDTTPVVAWSWSGNTDAVRSIGADGVLHAGAPAYDSSVVVTATLVDGGVTVSAQAAVTIQHLARRVQSVTLTGMPPGQALLSGDSVLLGATAHWSDGSDSFLAVDWSLMPDAGTAPAGQASLASSGEFSTTPFYAPRGSDPGQSAPDRWVVTASYPAGDGTTGSVSAMITVKPQVDSPVFLTIEGPRGISEGEAASYTATAHYADGGTDLVVASWVAGDTSMLVPTGPGTFQGGRYASHPDTPQTVPLDASRDFTYLDAGGRPTTVTLHASLDVTVHWLAPTLNGITFEAPDFLAPGARATTLVTGYYTKFGIDFQQAMPDAQVTSSDGTVLAVSGQALTAGAAPTLERSWVTVTAAVTPIQGLGAFTVSRTVTIDPQVAVQKRLLAYPWSPDDPDVQFRAISSDGHVDDYTVEPTGLYGYGLSSPATRRRLPLLAGVGDFVQTQAVNGRWGGSYQQPETQYIAAVEQGRVIVMRREDLYAASNRTVWSDPPAAPAVLADVADARALALIVKPTTFDGTQTASRLYVLEQSGAVRMYRLPHDASGPIAASDVVFERQLPGSYAALSGGAEDVLLLSADGTVFGEGADESFELSDHLFQDHWNAPFGVELGQDYCDPTCLTFVPMTGISMVFADYDESITVGSTQQFRFGRGLQQPPSIYWTTPYPKPRAVAHGVSVEADGSVEFASGEFVDDGEGPRDLFHMDGTATWLPPALQVVSARRQPQAPWPNGIGESYLSRLPPIVRTETDTLFYLDGLPILDGQGRPVVLP